METEKLRTVTREDEAPKEQQERRDKYFAHTATFMKGCPKLSGARLQRALKQCPPKKYRKAA